MNAFIKRVKGEVIKVHMGTGYSESAGWPHPPPGSFHPWLPLGKRSCLIVSLLLRLFSRGIKFGELIAYVI